MLPHQDTFFTSLYFQYFNQVKLYVLCFISDPNLAEEITQDTFTTAMMKIDDVMDAEIPIKWLKRTAKNKVLNAQRIHQRDLQRYISLSDPNVIEPISPLCVENTVIEQEEKRELESMEDVLQQTLTPTEITILNRHVIEHCGYLEISKELGISLWDCQKRMQRIRIKLAKRFPKYKKIKKL